MVRIGTLWAIGRFYLPIAVAKGEKVNKIDRPSMCHEFG